MTCGLHQICQIGSCSAPRPKPAPANTDLQTVLSICHIASIVSALLKWSTSPFLGKGQITMTPSSFPGRPGPIAVAVGLMMWFSLAGIAFAAPSELREYESQAWQSADGLPDTTVEAIAQTDDGYLWVGTRSGLARFDGVSFMQEDDKAMPDL